MTSYLQNRLFIFWTMTFLGASLFVLYIYFVQAGIFYLVSSQSWGERTRVLSSTISNLEGEYYKLTSVINEKSAHDNGFVDVNSVSIIKTNINLGVSIDSRGNRQR